MNRNEKALMRKLSREGRTEDFEQEKELMEANLNHYGLVKEEPKEVKEEPKKAPAKTKRVTKAKKEEVVEDVKDEEKE